MHRVVIHGPARICKGCFIVGRCSSSLHELCVDCCLHSALINAGEDEFNAVLAEDYSVMSDCMLSLALTPRDVT
jgi:hypothetical protein